VLERISQSHGIRDLIRQLDWPPNWLTWPARRDQAVARWVIYSAALTPVVLTAGWLTAGLLQPDSYSPMRQTVSSLAGYDATDRWVMTATLFLVGAGYLVTAAGLANIVPLARFLLVLAGLCAIGIATSPEPIGGPTAVHLAFTVVGGITITIWPAVAGWPDPRRPPIMSLRSCIIVTAAFVVLLGWTVLETRGGSALGLAERTTSSVQTTWPFVVAVLLRRTTVRHHAGAIVTTPDRWMTVRATDVQTGDVIRLPTGMEMLVSRVESWFMGHDGLIAFVEDSHSRWFKQPMPRTAEVEVKREAYDATWPICR
jgi:hypothetical membrane protein